jgi:UDP-glucose 4-epimerase
VDLTHKKVLLIGGAGLVGSHIVDQLLEEPVSQVTILDNLIRGTAENLSRSLSDSRVSLVKASMTDVQAVGQAVKSADCVFLLASLWLGECVHQPRRAWETNVLGSWNVVEACLEHNIQRLVYSSSASVYGNALFTPMTEEHPFNNRTTYGATKIAIEQMLRATYDQSRLPYIGMRYMNIYGPRMDYHGTYVSVIMKVLDRIFNNQPPVIFGDGSQVYDFIYVEDVARANILGMKAKSTDEFYNIGSGVGTSINELVEILLDLTSSDLTPDYRPQAQSFVTHRIGSTEKASQHLGFRATTPLIEGLRRVVEWRLSNKATG